MDPSQLALLPEEVLSMILDFLKILSPSLVLRLSSQHYDKNVSDVYKTVCVSGKTAESVVLGAMRPSSDTQIRICGMHSHEVDVNWNSRKVTALTHVKKLEFVDAEGIVNFQSVLSQPHELEEDMQVPPQRGIVDYFLI
ncbi:uncharacterized protein L201_001490 [Kwoniella dendrophila CBS 6074]|uniref:F-box domain-containing protein n=1 Tax=Kwoniella dendrophila CBS 6074 TaxID=1295534 RepID=A0AAX4JNZ9_9TREE